MSLLSSSEPATTGSGLTDSRSEYLLASTGSPGVPENAALQPASAEPARSRNGNKRNLEGETDAERQGADEWSKQPQENTGRKRRKQQSTGTTPAAETSINLPISSASLETSESITYSLPPEIQQDEAPETSGSLPPRRKRDTLKTPVVSTSGISTRPRRSTTIRQQETRSDGRLCLSSDSAFVETSPYFPQSTSTSRRSSRSRTKTLLSIPAASDMVVPGTPEAQKRVEHIEGLDIEIAPQHDVDNLGLDGGEPVVAEPKDQLSDNALEGSSAMAPPHMFSSASMPPVRSRRSAKSTKQEPDPDFYKDFDFLEYTRYVFSKNKGTVSVEQAVENIRNHGKWSVSVNASVDRDSSNGALAEPLAAAIAEVPKGTEEEDPKVSEQNHKHKDRKRKSKREGSKDKSKDEKRKKKKKKEGDSKDGTEHKDSADADKKKKRHHRKERKHEGDSEEKRSRRKERKREREKLKGEEHAQQEEAGQQSDVPAAGAEASVDPQPEVGLDGGAADSTPAEALASEPKSRSRKSSASAAKKSSKTRASASKVTVAVPAPGDGEQIVVGDVVTDDVDQGSITLDENRRPQKRRVDEMEPSDSKKVKVAYVGGEGSEINEEQLKDVNGGEEYQQSEHLLVEEIEIEEARRSPRKSTRASSKPKLPSESPSKRIPAGTSIIVPPPLDAPRFGLIQEEVRDNPYHLLVAVIFLQKTKGSSAIPVFRDFISKWPTPEELLHNGSEEDVRQCFVSLGLQTTRARSVWNIATYFSRINPDDKLQGPDQWIPRSDYVPEDPTGSKRKWGCTIGSIPGCGKYAIDSWRIFCMKPGEGGFLDGTTVGSRRRQEIAPGQEALPAVVYPQEFAPGDEEWRRIPADDPKLDKELKAYVQWMQAKDAAGFGTATSAPLLNDRDAEGSPDDWLENGASRSFA
ncbi:hypothetical protein TWF696_003696 [Orbilia brochopaga]|uniref:HhH-GPD domain-containing protein n=1 Tax=Orbilia brochopaga TaxID=3140254 RepID=A0AAV9V4J3_9PEZI